MEEKEFYALDLRCAEYDGKWGFVNNEGQFVIQPRFDRETEFIKECVAPVQVNGKWGLINAAGTYIIAPECDDPSELLDIIVDDFATLEKDVSRSIYEGLECDDESFFDDEEDDADDYNL